MLGICDVYRRIITVLIVLFICFCTKAQISGISVIKIDTRNSAAITSNVDWTNIASFVLNDPDNPENNISRTGLPQDDRIRGRGNSTWEYPKKPYRLRFRQNVSFFGLPAAENWVLLSEFLDPTFLTTAMAFELGRNVFDYQPFTCSYRHVHLYLNGSYEGIYVFTEHRQADPLGVGAPGRVKIDFSKGWFVEIDSYWDEEPKFKTGNYGLPIMIKSPEAPNNATNNNNPFYDYIKKDWNELCDSLASAFFPENGYRDLIDVNAFIDYLMINEIVRNEELEHPKSAFSYKDMDGKISMGPLWDFDWAYANGGTHIFFQTYTGYSKKYAFFNRFFQDPVFLALYKERWNEKYSKVSDVSNYITINRLNLKFVDLCFYISDIQLVAICHFDFQKPTSPSNRDI